MFTWFYIEGTQDVVYPTQLGRLAIDGSSPAGIVNLGEYHYTTLTRVNLVGKLVRLVALDIHGAGGILCNSITQLCLELLVGHSLVTQVDLTHLQNLLIGILGIANLINKPRITQSIGVLDGHCLATLQWEHKVAGVEHIDNRTDAVALNLSHVATSLGHSIHQALHLG